MKNLLSVIAAVLAVWAIAGFSQNNPLSIMHVYGALILVLAILIYHAVRPLRLQHPLPETRTGDSANLPMDIGRPFVEQPANSETTAEDLE